MDVLGRLLAEEIGRAHGPTMVIEDRPGAGTVKTCFACPARWEHAPDAGEFVRYQPVSTQVELPSAD
jgi:hypothetical protein